MKAPHFIPFALSLISLCLVYIGVALLPDGLATSVYIAAGIALGANIYLTAHWCAAWVIRSAA